MNYPPKPTSREGYFNDKIRLCFNKASALMYSAPEVGKYSDTNVVLPAPFGPAMITAFFDNGPSTVQLI